MKAAKILLTTILLSFILFFTSCFNSDSSDTLADIMEADRKFSALSEEKGMNHAFISYVDTNGILLRSNSMPLVGKDAIKERLMKFNDSLYTLTWEPLDGDIARSGDMGYTYGIYTMRRDSVEKKGTYVSIWKKKNGEWKYVLDTGNEGIGDKEE